MRDHSLPRSWRSPTPASLACSLVVLAALLVFAPEIAGQRLRRVFDFELLGGASRESLEQWVNAVERHRPGERDEAAVRIELTTKSYLGGVIAEFEQKAWTGVPGLPPPNSGAGAVFLERAVVLHTDVAVFTCTEVPDATALMRRTGLHLGAAMELVDFLRRHRRDDPFPLLWYRTALAFLQAQYEVSATPAFADRAASLFPDDPDTLLMAGCSRELTAAPRVQDAVDLLEDLRRVYGRERTNLQRAEEYYRRVTRGTPDLVEAHVRLARVLALLGRHAEALDTLLRAPDAPCDTEVQYYDNLFLGDELAAAGDGAAAQAAYDRAHELFPRARSVHLALSRLARQNADLGGAVRAVREALNLSVAMDPCNRYYMAGPARQAHLSLDRLRAQVPPPGRAEWRRP